MYTVQYFMLSRLRRPCFSPLNVNIYASLPRRRIALIHSMPCCHGTASSSSLWIVRYGVCTFFTQKMGEFSMNCSGASHGGAPMRDCVFSYWNARDMPVPQRMPPYALTMFETDAPASTAANMFVRVTRYVIW